MNKSKKQLKKIIGKKKVKPKRPLVDPILSNPQMNLLLVRSLRKQLKDNITNPLTRNQLIQGLKITITRLEASAICIKQYSL